MCGIAGILAADLPRRGPADEAMRAAIRYRGRDAEAEWSDQRHVRLFHARLSIIALADGGQPMHDRTGRYTIVANGEIYNYRELREEYARQGAQFRTGSDTEVILEGYRLKGPAVCRDLNGMFAFALWDSRSRLLFLARDRLGKKPLFWTTVGGRFYFASTLDAFAALPGWTGRLLPSAIDLYGRLGCFPDELTVYEQARALAPGCHAVMRPGQAAPEIERYWRLTFAKDRRMGLSEAAEAYEALLTDAIRLRLRADVPVALTFSGGVDSGTIAALAAKRLGVRLSCHTLDYDTPQEPSEETQIARRTAAHLGLDWRHIHYDYRQHLFDDLARTCQAFDQPSNQVPMAYSQRLYDAIRPHAKVVLGGCGGDELFTGYVGNERVAARDRLRVLARLVPGPVRRALPAEPRRWLARLLPDAADLARGQGDYLAAGLAGRPADDPAVAQVRRIVEDILESGVDTRLDLLQYMSLRYFGAEANFRLPDITGLRAQVEVRSPFLDHRMVELAARLPARLKVRRAGDARSVKFLPKHVYARHVPAEIAWASKKGMAMNVRFGLSFATDERFAAAFDRALDRIDDAGMDSARYRAARAAFVADFRMNRLPSRWAGVAMGGFMLGVWLGRRPLALDSAA